MKLEKFVFTILTTLSLIGSLSMAAPVCRDVFYYNPAVAQLVVADPVQQWLNWEQAYNVEAFRKSQTPVFVPGSRVDASTVNVTFLPSAPPVLHSLIERPDGVEWFRHPYNTNSTLPHYNDPQQTTLTTYFTASRSLALILGKNVFTLKMPTDHPHGPEGKLQKGKATTKEDITDGINRMSYIAQVDQKIGQDPQLILAKEVATVADKKTGEGYLIRDISFMNDGHYYLPALSIPYVGRKIAELNHQSPDAFWQIHYAELLGRSKAKLLLRYGLQMETPNSQNMLIQLDHDLRPTGVLIFRDISDTVLIEGIARGLGADQVLRRDAAMGVENSRVLRPYWRNSAWKFDLAGDNSPSPETLRNWGLAHDNAYKKEIEKALDVDLSQFTIIDQNPDFDKFMNSYLVQTKVKAYREKLESENKAL